MAVYGLLWFSVHTVVYCLRYVTMNIVLDRMRTTDQCLFIKIQILCNKNPTEIYRALKEVCERDTLDYSNIFRWTSQFVIEDDLRNGRP